MSASAGEKVDLLVGQNGATQPLLSMSQLKQPQYQNRALRFFFLIFLLGLLIIGCFTAYKTLNKTTTYQLEYNVYYPSQSLWKQGKMGFSEDEAVSRFVTENVTTLSDGFAHTTAVFINTSTPGLSESVCLVRKDDEYGMETANILPKHNTLDNLMKKTFAGKKIEVFMRQEVWVPDVFHAVDFNELPASVQELCYGVPIYTMIPKEEDDDESYYDESDDGIDDVMNDDESSEPTTTVTYFDVENDDNFSDENTEYSDQNPPYYGLPPPKLSDDEDEFDEDYYEIDPEYTAITPETRPECEDDSWLNRKKRQIDDERQKVRDGVGFNTKINSNLDLSLGEYDTDADLKCCHHCRKPYLICSQICVPIQQLTYPYYYRNCDYVQCSLMMPCAWWMARATGIA